MQGVSRAAQTQGRDALQRVLDSGADWSRVSEDLFAVVEVLDSSATLRRALGDPSAEGDAKRELVTRLFGGKVADGTVEILQDLAACRWSRERDLVDAVEELAVETQFATADAGGRADDVEEQLFRFERTVAGTPELRDAVDDPRRSGADKAALVDRLTAGKTHPEVQRLLLQAARRPRGRRFATTVEEYLAVGERRRDQLSAVVTVAGSLTREQHDRLAASLEKIYGRRVVLKVVVDETVVGGIRVQVGDEVVDGTVSRRLEDARRFMGS